MYDITNRKSFEKLDLWLDDIEQCASEEMVVMLIGNKADLED